MIKDNNNLYGNINNTKEVLMKKIILASSMAAMIALVGCNANKNVTAKTEEDKTFYSVGNMFGQRLSTLNLNESELAMLAQGLRDGANKKKPEGFEVAKYQGKVRELFQKRMKVSSAKVQDEGKKYLAKFVADGAKKTASGLAYKIEKAGTGKQPKATDTVEVHYKGTLLDGTVFDSSYDRKKKVTFPLNRVIKGWTEGLQLLKEGGKIKLVIPAALAYGDNGAPPKIPGGATLVFDIELFTVKSGAKAKK